MERRDFFAATVGALLAAATMGRRERRVEPEASPQAAQGAVRTSQGTWDPVSDETWRDAFMRLHRERLQEHQQQLAEASHDFVRRHVDLTLL